MYVHLVNVNNSTLIINTVLTTDGGNYTCNVTNIVGNASNIITVYSESLCYIHI